MNASKPAASGQVGEADERLLIEAAQQNPARFAELYELNFERVYAFIARRVRDRDLTQDLTAEVFHKALANLPRFKWRGAPFAAWLFRISANLIADRGKRVAREGDISNVDNLGEISPVNLEQVERIAGLYRLVAELPPDQRRVISLRFAEEKSIREIANEMDRSEGAIKQLQFRGLESLRAQMSVGQSEQDG